MTFTTLLNAQIELEGRIPWSQGMSLGDGFDATESHTCQSPYIMPETTALSRSLNHNLEIHHEIIQDGNDMISAFKLCTKDLMSREELYASPAVDFLRHGSDHERCLRAVIRCLITTSPETMDKYPESSHDAQVYLDDEGEEAFLNRYGTHYVAGHIRQSEFTAVIQQPLGEAEDASSAGKSLQQLLVDLFSATDKSKNLVLPSDFAATKVSFAYTGSRYILDKPVNSLVDILPVYTGWKSMIRPKPRIALIKHHSLAFHKIVHPRSVWKIDSEIFQAHVDLLELVCWMKQVKISLSPFLPSVTPPELQVLQKRLTEILTTTSVESTNIELERWRYDFENQKELLTKKMEYLTLRCQFLNRVHISRTEDAWPKKTKLYPTRAQPVFVTGLVSSQHPELLRPSINLYVWDFSKSAEDAGIVQKEVLRYSPSRITNTFPHSRSAPGLLSSSNPDTVGGSIAFIDINDSKMDIDQPIIIGMRATSDREPDHHNNGWFRLMKGGVGFPFVELFFETSHWRGAEWTVEIWSI